MGLKKNYLHVERIGRAEVEGILDGKCYVYPKMDGSNASVWADADGIIHTGSRTRECYINDDNQGFSAYVNQVVDGAIEKVRSFCRLHPDMVVFGEWLCKTKLGKSYINRNVLYVFDVYDLTNERYLNWNEYSVYFSDYPYLVEPIAVLDNPTVEQLKYIADNNHVNLPDNVVGEGIVIKNYDFKNASGEYNVAKIVREEFLDDKKKKEIIPPEEYERMFVEDYITPTLINKCRDKVFIALDSEELNNKSIGMMMTMVWKDAIEEELFEFLKKKKNLAVIDFGRLNSLVKCKMRDFLGL